MDGHSNDSETQNWTMANCASLFIFRRMIVHIVVQKLIVRSKSKIQRWAACNSALLLLVICIFGQIFHAENCPTTTSLYLKSKDLFLFITKQHYRPGMKIGA